MLRKLLSILEVGVLLFVEGSAETACAQKPDCSAIFKVSKRQLELNIRVFQSVSQQPQMKTKDPRVNLVVPNQRVKLLSELRTVDLDNRFSHKLQPDRVSWSVSTRQSYCIQNWIVL